MGNTDSVSSSMARCAGGPSGPKFSAKWPPRPPPPPPHPPWPDQARQRNGVKIGSCDCCLNLFRRPGLARSLERDREGRPHNGQWTTDDDTTSVARSLARSLSLSSSPPRPPSVAPSPPSAEWRPIVTRIASSNLRCLPACLPGCLPACEQKGLFSSLPPRPSVRPSLPLLAVHCQRFLLVARDQAISDRPATGVPVSKSSLSHEPRLRH